MFTVFRKEMKLYFSGVFAYLIIAAFLLGVGVFTSIFNLYLGLTEFSYVLMGLQWILIPLIPLLTMRSFAEERKNRTDLLLFSLPLRTCDVLLGKYLALLGVLALPLLVLALLPILLSFFGEISLPLSYVGFCGFLLMLLALISVCAFISSLFQKPLVAAGVSFAVLLVLYLLGFVAAWIPEASAISWVAELLSAINLFSRFGGFAYGAFDLNGAIFYISTTVLFLFLTALTVKSGKRA